MGLGDRSAPSFDRARIAGVGLPPAEFSTEGSCADAPHVVGDVGRYSRRHDLVDAVKQVARQLDPVGGEVVAGQRLAIASRTAGTTSCAHRFSVVSLMLSPGGTK